MGLIYIDSCLLIYAVEDDRKWGDRSKAAIAEAEADTLAISPLVKLECLVGPLKRRNPTSKATFVELFKQFALLDLPETVYLKASELRARSGLKTPDALHLACAQHHRCDALWTNDGGLHKIAGDFARNVLA